ncbi:UPF0104 family protein, partial [Myxococcus llanfairpwllgwyngyllgogerychwyrndrobwllllantysiliogogogochensis]
AMASLSLSPGVARGLGFSLLGVLLGYLVLCARMRRTLKVERLHLKVSLPTLRQALEQLVVSCLDWSLAAMVLWVLLPSGVGISPPSMVALFAVAQLVGIASQVPGGLGVFDSIILAALTPEVPASMLLGTLVVYRIVYYLLPFAVAAVMLLGHELSQHRGDLSELRARLGRRRQEG